MAGLKETASTPSEGISDIPSSTRKASVPKKAIGQGSSISKGATRSKTSGAKSSAPVKSTRRVFTHQERAQKLGRIEKLIARGETVRNAVNQVGVSEQTYYHWKRTSSPVSSGDDLKDLVALEEENRRLKSLLAERLRKENAELKKKLGLG